VKVTHLKTFEKKKHKKKTRQIPRVGEINALPFLGSGLIG